MTSVATSGMFSQTATVAPTRELTESKPYGVAPSADKRVRVPLAAFVHETGEFIQANCCLTPWCSQFGFPVLSTPGGEVAGDFAFYETRVERNAFGRTSATVRFAPQFKCKFCESENTLISNRSLAEVISPFIIKYAPAAFCRSCSEQELDAKSCASAYSWEYGDFGKAVTQRMFETATGALSGNRRFECRWKPKSGENSKCGSKNKSRGARQTSAHRGFPQGFGKFLAKPESHVLDLHHASFMTLNQFRRSWVNKGGSDGGSGINRCFKPNLYYRALNWYHFLAVEWLGFYNNQIRQGRAKIIGAATHVMLRKKQKAAEAKLKKPPEEEANLEMAEDQSEGTDEFTPEKEDVGKKQASRVSSLTDIPQVQTDTLVLSVATPGFNDKQQQARLTISAMAPSGYILLSTLNFTDSHDVTTLLEMDIDTAGGNWAASRGHINRELAMHAHLQRRNEPHSQNRRDLFRGTTVMPNFDGNSALIRQPYHEFAHYYTLEKILRGIKGEILLSMDGEAISIRACMWAFRERIKSGKCHVIQVSSDRKAGGPIADVPVKEGLADLSKDAASIKAEFSTQLAAREKARLEAQSGKKSKESGEKQTLLKSEMDEILVFSSAKHPILGQKWQYKPPEHKKKVWLSCQSFLEVKPKQAALLLRTATLFHVDSICNQMRQRLPGFYRGMLGAQRDHHSYLSHWRIPVMLQRCADIFAFSKNCLAWHSLGKSYRPACHRLGLERKAGLHLTDYARNYLRPDFNEKKFGVRPGADDGEGKA